MPDLGMHASPEHLMRDLMLQGRHCTIPVFMYIRNCDRSSSTPCRRLRKMLLQHWLERR